MSIQNNIAVIRQDIADYASLYGQTVHEKPMAQLMAVSKFHDTQSITQAIDAGQVLFGENRVQEALEKFTPLKQQYPHIKLHLIGPLQTNKVNKALGLFDVIQTLDREELAQNIAGKKQQAPLPAMLVQVNTGEEPQKAGIAPLMVKQFVQYCQHDLALPIIGLMAIPPQNVHIAPHFALLKKYCQELGLAECSMGMSADYKEAIRQGSTMIRVGSGIFGARAASA